CAKVGGYTDGYYPGSSLDVW
nr:immunoglobulin heavy chain junction region [Macaca mulatta]